MAEIQEINGRQKVTITDIARESGVSPATVSLVLRNKPGVGQSTRQRVIENAQNLGYFDSSKKSLASTKIKSVGLIIKLQEKEKPLNNDFYNPVLAGIEASCRTHNINLLYANLLVDEENQPLDAPRLLREQQAEGLLIVGAYVDETLQQILQRRQIPVVLVDGYAVDNVYDAVISDNEYGGFTATTHLIEQGHHHLAIVGSSPESYPSILGRRAGYLQALTAHGLTPHFIDCHLNHEEAAPAVTAYLQKHPEVTALFCCNDWVAIGVMNALKAAGRRVPEDISIIGFDNINLAHHVSPALTTMRVDKRGMGRLALDLLLNRLKHPEMGQLKMVMRPNLIVRESVAPPLNE